MAEDTIPREAKVERPQYFDDPAVDQLHAIVVAMSAEIATLYDRCDTLERLLVERGVIAAGAVTSFEPDDVARDARAREREALIGRLFRAVRANRAALVATATRSDGISGAGT